ncbi:MAG: hypothetical protein ABIA93_02990, partial [Candidatus Woesearchaeota archaeon]
SKIKHEITVLRDGEKFQTNRSEDEYMKGLFYLVSKNYDLAIDSFRDVLDDNPNHFAAKVRLQEALVHNKVIA